VGGQDEQLKLALAEQMVQLWLWQKGAENDPLAAASDAAFSS